MRKLVLLFVVACIVYLPTFANQFVWDDEQFITKNAFVQNIANWPIYFTTNTIAGAGLSSNYYRPLTTFSFAIDYAIWGAHPFGFHLTNLLLHAVGGVLVYLLLKKLLEIYSADTKYDLLAYLTTFAFVLHPAQVEAVAYMNSRGDSLSLVYGTLSVLLLIATQHQRSDNRRILLGCASVLSFVVALLTKESAVAWVGVMIVYVLLLRAKKVTIRPGVWLLAILNVFITLFYMLSRFTFLQFQTTDQVWGPSSVYAHSLPVRMLTFGFVSIPQYLGILFWPVGLHMERDSPLIQSLHQVPPLSILLTASFLIVTLMLCVVLLRKRASLAHPVFVGLLLLVVLMAPFSGIVPLNGAVYEHWLYAPMVGFWLVVFSLLQSLLPKKLFIGFVVTILVLWGIASMHQITIWRSPLTLFPNILKYTDSSRVHVELGMAYADTQNLPQAESEYYKALALSDLYPQTHHNLANLLVNEGKYASAEAEYKKALAMDPHFFFSFDPLIQVEIALKNKNEAEKWMNQALQLFPNDPELLQLQQKVNALP